MGTVSGFRPLHYAVAAGSVGCVRALLAGGARLDLGNEVGHLLPANALSQPTYVEATLVLEWV